jgi:hypothetical protein
MDPDPGGPKTCGSKSPTLVKEQNANRKSNRNRMTMGDLQGQDDHENCRSQMIFILVAGAECSSEELGGRE